MAQETTDKRGIENLNEREKVAVLLSDGREIEGQVAYEYGGQATRICVHDSDLLDLVPASRDAEAQVEDPSAGGETVGTIADIDVGGAV